MSSNSVDLSSEALTKRFNLDASLPKELLDLVDSVKRVEILGDSLSQLAELYRNGKLFGHRLQVTHAVLEYLVSNDLPIQSVFFHWMTENNWRTWQKYRRHFSKFISPLTELKKRLKDDAQPRLFVE
jgi:hypothetical protein